MIYSIEAQISSIKQSNALYFHTIEPPPETLHDIIEDMSLRCADPDARLLLLVENRLYEPEELPRVPLCAVLYISFKFLIEFSREPRPGTPFSIQYSSYSLPEKHRLLHNPFTDGNVWYARSLMGRCMPDFANARRERLKLLQQKAFRATVALLFRKRLRYAAADIAHKVLTYL